MAEASIVCVKCLLDKPASAYSKCQRKKRSTHRKCQDCVKRDGDGNGGSELEQDLRPGILVKLVGLSNPTYNNQQGTLNEQVPTSGRWNVTIGTGLSKKTIAVKRTNLNVVAVSTEPQMQMPPAAPRKVDPGGPLYRLITPEHPERAALAERLVCERLDPQFIKDARAGFFYAVDVTPIFISIPPYTPPSQANQNSRLDEGDAPELTRLKEATVLVTACFEIIKTTCLSIGFTKEEGLAVCEMLSDGWLWENLCLTLPVITHYSDTMVWFGEFATQLCDGGQDTEFCHNVIEGFFLMHIHGKPKLALEHWNSVVGRNFETWPRRRGGAKLPSPRARSKVLFIRSFLKVQTNDLVGARKDLDVAIETCSLIGLISSRLTFTMQAIEGGHVDQTVFAAFERDARMLVEQSHADDRHLDSILDQLAMMCAQHGTAAFYEEGKALHQRANVAKKRTEYLYGQLFDGKSLYSGDGCSVNTANGFLRSVAKDIFDWDSNTRNKLTTAELKKKYTSIARRLPRDFVKRIISGAEAGRESATVVPFFATGTAVLVQTADFSNAAAVPNGSNARGGGGGTNNAGGGGGGRDAAATADVSKGVVRGIEDGGLSYTVSIIVPNNGKRNCRQIRTLPAAVVRLRFPLQMVQNEDENDDICAICHELPSIEPVELLCGHEFCAVCLDQLAKSSGDDGVGCPLCRKPLAKSDLEVVQNAVTSRPEADLAKEIKTKLAKMTERAMDAVQVRLVAFMESAESRSMASIDRSRVLDDFAVEIGAIKDEAVDNLLHDAVEDKLYTGLQTGEHPHDRMRSIIGAVTNLVINDVDLYGDGDQSMVDDTLALGCPGELFHTVWANGSDLNDWYVSTKAGTEEMFANHALAAKAFTGSYEAVSRAIEETEPGSNARYELLEKRISMSRLTPLMLAIVGERTLKLVMADGTTQFDDTRAHAYTQTINILLAAGARPDAKDIAGHTALHHATSLMTTRWARDVCSRLLVYGAGANVNEQNRFLCTPLHVAAQSQDSTVITVLMHLGADINVKNVQRNTPIDLAIPHHKRLMKKLCSFCNKAGALHICSQCKAVTYCDAVCQKKDWKTRHKKLCAKEREQLAAKRLLEHGTSFP